MFGPDQVGALHEAKVDSRRAVEMLEAMDKRLKLVEDQLLGPEQQQWPTDQRNPQGGRGWPQLGKNKSGQWLTLVDFLSHISKGRK